jgi:hypothetical protein
MMDLANPYGGFGGGSFFALDTLGNETLDAF